MFIKYNLANILCKGGKSWARPWGKIMVKILGARSWGKEARSWAKILGQGSCKILASWPRCQELGRHYLGHLDLGRDLAQDLGKEFLLGECMPSSHTYIVLYTLQCFPRNAFQTGRSRITTCVAGSLRKKDVIEYCFWVHTILHGSMWLEIRFTIKIYDTYVYL